MSRDAGILGNIQMTPTDKIVKNIRYTLYILV